MFKHLARNALLAAAGLAVILSTPAMASWRGSHPRRAEVNTRLRKLDHRIAGEPASSQSAGECVERADSEVRSSSSLTSAPQLSFRAAGRNNASRPNVCNGSKDDSGSRAAGIGRKPTPAAHQQSGSIAAETNAAKPIPLQVDCGCFQEWSAP